jgi:1,4-alpha-glucan branching enzyme
LFIEENPPDKTVQIIEGSWGQGSSHWVWLNDWTTWTWKKVYECEAKSEQLISKYYNTKNPDLERVLKQMARELLLLESSDWQFLISTWSARDYAEQRVALHFENFTRIYNIALALAENRSVDIGDWEYLLN